MDSGLSPFGLPRNDARANANFVSHLKLIWVVQSSGEKYSACVVGQIKSISLRHPALA